MKKYKELLEAINHRRFDLMRTILEAKKEIKALADSHNDTFNEWRDHRLEEAFDWLYGMNAVSCENYFTMKAKWEHANQGWIVASGSVRRAQKTNNKTK